MKRKNWIFVVFAAIMLLFAVFVFIHRRVIRAVVTGKSAPDCPHWLPDSVKEKLPAEKEKLPEDAA